MHAGTVLSRPPPKMVKRRSLPLSFFGWREAGGPLSSGPNDQQPSHGRKSRDREEKEQVMTGN